MNGRNEYLDMLKGIAIILMVFGHCIQLGSGSDYIQNELFYENIFFRLIYIFHMPLFMGISGYLFFHSYKNHGNHVIAKKAKSFLLPVFTVLMLKSIYHLVMSQNEVTIYALFHNMFANFATLWFLQSLFCNVVYVFLLEKIRYKKCFLLITFVGMLFLPDSYLLFIFKFMLPFFIVGYYIHKKQIQFPTTKRTLLVLTVLYIICSVIYHKQCYIYVSGVTLLGKNYATQISIDLFRYFAGAIGIYFICILVYHVQQWSNQKNVVSGFIMYCGKNSLGIYIVSTEVLNLILAKVAETYSVSLLNHIVECIIVLLVSLVVTKLFSMFKYTRLLFLGQ